MYFDLLVFYSDWTKTGGENRYTVFGVSSNCHVKLCDLEQALLKNWKVNDWETKWKK